MAHKKNGKSKAINQATILQQEKDTNVSATIKLPGKAAEMTDSGKQAASESCNPAATNNKRRAAGTYS